MSNSTNALGKKRDFRDSFLRRCCLNLIFFSVILCYFIRLLSHLDLKCDFFKKIIQKVISICRAILNHNLLIAYRMHLQKHCCCLCLGMGLTTVATKGLVSVPVKEET